MTTLLPPLPALRNMERLARMFNEFWPETDELRWANQPLVDIKETDDELVILMDLPGVKEEDIHVEVVGDCLTIRAERKFQDEERRKDYVRIERSYGSYQRSFTLNFPVKPETVRADYDNGVLRVVVPKAEPAKVHRVPISHNGK